MTNHFRRSVFGLLLTATLLAGEMYADTFEFLSYKMPQGWASQPVQEGVAYKRSNGVGLIYFYPSYASTGSAAEEFAKMWRARVEPAFRAQAPQPQLQREGDFTAAIGGGKIDDQGTIATVSLVAFVGKGKRSGF